MGGEDYQDHVGDEEDADLPEQGVAEPGVHGYEYQWLQGDQEEAPGYEPQDPQEVLRSLYGSMGLRENRQYAQLDRGSAQALLRVMRARKPKPEPSLPIPPGPIESPVTESPGG